MNPIKQETIKIDVYADVVCPWCYIGKRRLDQAIAQRPDLKIERSWKPFQLRPEMPTNGVEWERFMETKFGGVERALAAFARLSEAGAPDGIEFRFDRIQRAPNTADAQRLVLYAAERGLEWEMSEALFSAYFTHGRDIGDQQTLALISQEVGLNKDEVYSYLTSGENRDLITANQEAANQIGVTGVPFYVLNERYGISGAQPVETFVAALDRITELEQAA